MLSNFALALWVSLTALPKSLARNEDGADAIEYFLTIGGISVAVVAAFVALAYAPLGAAILDFVCGQISTLGVTITC